MESEVWVSVGGAAPKSNRGHRAVRAGGAAAREYPGEGVPMHIRNAPNQLMKELGYHEGYQYAHAVPEAYIPQEYLPDVLRGTGFYEPGPFGFEKDIAKRMAWWNELKNRVSNDINDDGPADSAAGGRNDET